MEKDGQNSQNNSLVKIIIGALIGVLTLGSSPWWWKEFFAKNDETEKAKKELTDKNNKVKELKEKHDTEQKAREKAENEVNKLKEKNNSEKKAREKAENELNRLKEKTTRDFEKDFDRELSSNINKLIDEIVPREYRQNTNGIYGAMRVSFYASSTHQAQIFMNGNYGIARVRLEDDDLVEQDLKLVEGADGIFLQGSKPINLYTGELASYYYPDNFYLRFNQSTQSYYIDEVCSRNRCFEAKSEILY